MPDEGYHGDYLIPWAEAFLREHKDQHEDRPVLIRFALHQALANIKKDLEDFGVTFDSWFSEASFVDKGLVEKHVEMLRERGFVEESEGAIWFVAPEDKKEGDEQRDKNRVLKKRDGRWTYFATDVAYHANKFERGFT